MRVRGTRGRHETINSDAPCLLDSELGSLDDWYYTGQATNLAKYRHGPARE